MATQFYHMSQIENLAVVCDGEDGYMVRVTLMEGAQPSEPSGLINSYVAMTSRNHGFPATFGYERKIVPAVDAPRTSLEDFVEFFEDAFKNKR